MMRIEGYAVVCENDCIADATGAMPEALKTDAEWAFFQAGLDASDVIVLGRKSHEVTPNPKARRRLVLTSRVENPHREDERTVFWNPKHAAIDIPLKMFGGKASILAVTGGKAVFDYILGSEAGFTCFHLSRVQDVYLKDGTKVFSALEAGGATAESLLKAKGYEPGEWRQLDDVASVVSWRRANSV